MDKYLFSYIVLFFFICTCSKQVLIGNQKVKVEEFPQKVIWLQIAGLSEEHLPIIKFILKDASNKLSFSQFSCFGKAWNYNLYKLEPTPIESMLAQLTGKKNIKNLCFDKSHLPLWNNFSQLGYSSGILRSGLERFSAKQKSLECLDNKEFGREIIQWQMDKSQSTDKKQIYHVDRPQNFKKGVKYYDLSCQNANNTCYSDVFDNINYLLEFLKNKKKYFFVVQDFTLYNDSLKNKTNNVYNYLIKLNSILYDLLEKIKGQKKALLLVSSIGPVDIKLPPQGAQWSKLSHLQIDAYKGKKRQFFTPVWAMGASSEKFCGMYDEVDIYHKFFP